MPDRDYAVAPPGDFVLPFDLPNAGVRGRLVRLDAVSAQVLAVHAMPEAAGRVMGELLVLVALLGSLLKLDGRLTAQTKSAGALDLVVADYYGAEAGGRGLRGYARINAEKFAALGEHPSFAAMNGAGSLAITVRPRVDARDYQGVVQLSSAGLAASAQEYFRRSEQLETFVKLAAAPAFTPGVPLPSWRAGGLLLQVTPDDRPRNADDWNRLATLAATLEDVELVDVELPAEKLLWRLFHQDEGRLLPAEPLAFRCDCSRENIESVLRAYAPQDRAKLADPDGIIRAHCEFCGAVHEVALSE
jgi:molecular chaperone Hsp33